MRGMDNRLKFNIIRKMVNRHAMQGNSRLPIAVITDTNSFLYARRGKVIDYQDNMWLCLAIELEQHVGMEHSNKDFRHYQELIWWFLPPNIKLVDWDES